MRRKRYAATLTCRLSSEVLEWLREMAAVKRISESEYLRDLVEREYEAARGGKPKARNE